MKFTKMLNLRLFGEGDSGAPAGETAGTAESVVNTADDGQKQLLDLGVPREKLRKRANRQADFPGVHAAKNSAGAEESAPDTDQAAADPHEKETQEKKKTWDELMEDPEYKAKMQETVQKRLAKTAEKRLLEKLAPVFDSIGTKYGLDTSDLSKLDVEALVKSVTEDNSYYDKLADDMGVSPDVARRMDLLQKQNDRAEAEKAATMEQQTIQAHIARLQQQGEALKAVFPSFQLQKELENPTFARMTSPGVGLSVEDAYYAVHREEIQKASMQVAAQKTAQQLASSMQAAQRRPVENGTSKQAASSSALDYKTMSKDQRAQFKRMILEAEARGEKVYPNY